MEQPERSAGPPRARHPVAGWWVVASWLLLPSVALAGGEHLTMRGSAGYQLYDYDNAWMAAREHTFHEEVRAALAGYIVSQQLASYHLGIALDNRTILDGTSQANTLGWQYDGRVDFWRNGEVPVSLYANRQITSFSSAAVPTATTTSETYGYSLGLQPYRLPKIRTHGWWQSQESTQGDYHTRLTNSDLSATLTQSANATVVRAAAEWQRNSGPAEDQARESRSGDLDVDYRLNDKVEVVARGSSRSYTTSYGEDPLALTTEDSDLIVRFRPDKRTRAAAYTRHYRNVFGESGYTGFSSGALVGRSFAYGFRGQAEGGYSWDTANDDGDIRRFTGENVRADVSNAQSGNWGSAELGAGAGTAWFTELGKGGGLQTGVSGNASAGRSVAANLLRMNVGAEVRRQWDTSPVNLDLMGWGWRAGLSTRPLLGTTVAANVGQASVDQLSQDEGDSMRSQAWAVASKRFTPEIRATYTFSAEQASLDEESSRSIGHAARADAKVTQYFTLSGMVYQTSWSGSGLDPWDWWRAEGIASFLTPKFVFETRVSYDWSGSDGRADHGTTFVQAVLSRRFDWNF